MIIRNESIRFPLPPDAERIESDRIAWMLAGMPDPYADVPFDPDWTPPKGTPKRKGTKTTDADRWYATVKRNTETYLRLRSGMVHRNGLIDFRWPTDSQGTPIIPRIVSSFVRNRIRLGWFQWVTGGRVFHLDTGKTLTPNASGEWVKTTVGRHDSRESINRRMNHIGEVLNGIGAWLAVNPYLAYSPIRLEGKPTLYRADGSKIRTVRTVRIVRMPDYRPSIIVDGTSIGQCIRHGFTDGICPASHRLTIGKSIPPIPSVYGGLTGAVLGVSRRVWAVVKRSIKDSFLPHDRRYNREDRHNAVRNERLRIRAMSIVESVIADCRKRSEPTKQYDIALRLLRGSASKRTRSAIMAEYGIDARGLSTILANAKRSLGKLREANPERFAV